MKNISEKLDISKHDIAIELSRKLIFQNQRANVIEKTLSHGWGLLIYQGRDKNTHLACLKTVAVILGNRINNKDTIEMNQGKKKE